jgi:hypothetical protein
MHKVQGNYGSCTWGVVKMHPTSVEASGKGEDGVKPGWNSVEHRKWCVLEFDPQLKANVIFWRFFFDLTRFSTKLDGTGAVFPWVYGKHCETPWKLVPACFNTPSKNIQLIPSNVFKKSVSNGTKPTGRSSLCGKTSDPRSENRNENLGRFSLKKWFMTQRWFLLAFAFEHFQHYSGDDPTNLFPHPSLVLDSFATPPIKLNRDSKSLRDHWSQTTWTDHHDGPTFSVAVRSHIIRYF